MEFLLSKWNGDLRGMGIVEVLWKTVSGDINCHIGVVIKYHIVFRGLRVGRGTGAAFLKEKLLQKLTAMR